MARIDPLAAAIGQAVKTALAEADMTQHEASATTGIAYASLSRRLNGAIPFTFPELIHVARVTGVPLSGLIESAERIIARQREQVVA